MSLFDELFNNDSITRDYPDLSSLTSVSQPSKVDVVPNPFSQAGYNPPVQLPGIIAPTPSPSSSATAVRSQPEEDLFNNLFGPTTSSPTSLPQMEIGGGLLENTVDVDKAMEGYQAKVYGEQKKAAEALPAPERSIGGEIAASVGRGLLNAGSDVMLKAPSWIFGDVLRIPGVKDFFAPAIQRVEMGKLSPELRPGAKAGGASIDLERIVTNPGGVWEGIKEVAQQTADNVTNAYFWASQAPEQVGSLLSIAAWSKGFSKLATMISKAAPAMETAARASQADALYYKATQMGINGAVDAAIKAKNYDEVARLGTALATNLVGAGATAATMGGEFAKFAQITNQLQRYSKIGMYGGAVMVEAMQGLQALDEYEQEHGTTSSWGTRVMAPLLTGLIAGPMEAFSLDKIIGMFKGGAGAEFAKKILEGVLTEGITEAMQTVAENAVEKYGYNPDKKLLEGVVEATLLGAAMGGVGGGAGGIVTHRRGQLQKALHQAWLEEQAPTPQVSKATAVAQPNYALGMPNAGPQQPYGDTVTRTSVPERSAGVSEFPAPNALNQIGPQVNLPAGLAPGYGTGGQTYAPFTPSGEVPARATSPMGSTSSMGMEVMDRVPVGGRLPQGIVPTRSGPAGPMQTPKFASSDNPARAMVEAIRREVESQPVSAEFPVTKLSVSQIMDFADNPDLSIHDLAAIDKKLTDYQTPIDNIPALPFDEIQQILQERPDTTFGELVKLAINRVVGLQDWKGELLPAALGTMPESPGAPPRASVPPMGVTGAAVTSIAQPPAETAQRMAERLVGGMAAAPNVGPQLPPLGGTGNLNSYGAPTPENVNQTTSPVTPAGLAGREQAAGMVKLGKMPAGIVPSAAPPVEADIPPEAPPQTPGTMTIHDLSVPDNEDLSEPNQISQYLQDVLELPSVQSGEIAKEVWKALKETDNDTHDWESMVSYVEAAILDSHPEITQHPYQGKLFEDLARLFSHWYLADLDSWRNYLEELRQEQTGEEPAAPPTWKENITNGTFAEQIFHRIAQAMEYDRQLNIANIKAELRDLKGDTVTNEEWNAVKKEVEEAVELAVVWHTRLIYEQNAFLQSGLQDVNRLYQAQPNLNTRTSDSVVGQAYSTPAPLAYVINKIFNPQENQTAFDPTAGNGMLLVGMNPEMSMVNELDPGRLNQLRIQGFDVVTNWDATTMAQRGNFPSQTFDFVMMNPPFGKTKTVNFDNWDGDKYKIGKLEHVIALNGLQAMKPNGKAAIIIGGHFYADIQGKSKNKLTDANRRFLNYLFQNYNVTNLVEISGDIYRKMGTSFPISLIMIDGKIQEGQERRFAPRTADQVQKAETVQDVADILTGGMNSGNQGKLAIRLPSGIVVGKPKTGGVGARLSDTLQLGEDNLRRPNQTRGGVPTGQTGGGGGVVSPGARPPSGGAGGGDTTGTTPTTPGGNLGGGGTNAQPPAGGGTVPGDGEQEARPDQELAEGGDLGPGVSRRGGVPERRSGTRNVGGGYEGISSNDLIRLLAGELQLSVKESRSNRDSAVKAIEALQGAEADADGLHIPIDTTTQAGVDAVHNLAGWVIQNQGLWDIKDGKVPFAPNITFEQLQGYFDSLREGSYNLADLGSTEYQYWQAIYDSLIPADAIHELATFKKEMVDDSGLQAYYKPRSKGQSLNTVVPHRLAEAMTQALSRFEDKYGDIDRQVATWLGYATVAEMHQYLGAEQVDSVGLAIDQINSGNGLIVGHQTGVGKGRIAAAMLQYARRLGKKPIFLTSKPNLFSALHMDLQDIGHPMRPLIIASGDNASITNANGDVVQKLDKKAINEALRTSSVPDGYDCVFIMYSQLNGSIDYNDVDDNGRKIDPKKRRGPLIMTPANIDEVEAGDKTSRLQFQKLQLIARLAEDNIVILDESQNAAGESQTGQFFNRLVIPYTKGVLYSSATFSKNVKNFQLYNRTALGDQPNLQANLARLGTAGQEWVAMQLAKEGQMVRNEQRFDCEFNFNIDKANAHKDIDRSDRIMHNIRQILALDGHKNYVQLKGVFASEIARDMGGAVFDADGSPLNASVTLSNFASTVHNFVSSVLFMTRTQPTIDAALRMLRGDSKVGQRKPVIAVYNTMDSLIDAMIDQGAAAEGEPFSSDFHQLMYKTLNNTRRVSIKPPGGGTVRHYYLPMERIMALDSTRTMWREIERYIKENVPTDLPVSPLDEMTTQLTEAGYQVGEITARAWKIVKNADGVPILQKRTNDDKDRNKILANFNNGRGDVLIINSAGAEGLSAHASAKYTDKWSFEPDADYGAALPRGMVLSQFSGDINTVIQMLGRINRTGQIHRPGFEVVISDLPGEKRPMVTLLKKLRSLSANTTGNDKTWVDLPVDDVFNDYGDEALAQTLINNPTLNLWLDNPLGISEQSPEPPPAGSLRNSGDFIRRLSGKMAILPVAVQNAAWDDIAENYKEIVDHAKQTGEYNLESQELPLDAKIVNTYPLSPAQRAGYSALSEPTIIEELDVAVLRKPWTAKEIGDKIARTFSRVIARPVEAGSPSAEGRASIDQMAKAAARGEKDVGKFFTGERVQVKQAKSQRDLEYAFREQIVSKIVNEATEWGTNELARYPDWTEDQRNSYWRDLRSQVSEIRELINGLNVGHSYDLRHGPNPGDVVPVVLVDIKVKKTTGNPIARSRFAAVFAINSGLQYYTVNLHRISDNWRYSKADTNYLATWDQMSPKAERERAYMITGNLLAIPARDNADNPPGTPPKPVLQDYLRDMVYFTYSDGTTGAGIRLASGFDINLVKVSVDLTADQAKQLLTRQDILQSQNVPRGRTPFVDIRRGDNRYVVTTPLSQQHGRTYYADETLASLVQDGRFVSQGNRMVGFVSSENLLPFIERTMELGAVYQMDQQDYINTFVSAMKVKGETSEAQVANYSGNATQWGKNLAQNEAAGRRLFEAVKASVMADRGNFGTALDNAEHFPELRAGLSQETLDLFDNHGVAFVGVKGAEVDGLYHIVNGTPVIVVDSFQSRGDLDVVARHELLHHLIQKINPEAMKVKQGVDYQTEVFQAYKQAINEARASLGLGPLTAEQMAEEFAADYFAGLDDFFYKGKTYLMSDGFIDIKAVQGYITSIEGQTVAQQQAAATEAYSGKGDLAVRLPFFGKKQQQTPPAPQPTRGPYKHLNTTAYQAPRPEGWKAPFQALKEIFNAEGISQWAKKTHSILVKHMGLASRVMAQKEAILREYRKDFDKLTRAQFLDFMDAAENGMPIPKDFGPRLQDAVNKWRVISDELHQEIENRSKGFFTYVEDYMSRLYKRPEEAEKALRAVRESQKGQKEVKGGASLTGTADFKKPRTVDFMSVALTPLGETRTINGVTYEGLGLESRFPNYVDSMLANIHEKLRFIMGVDMFEEWRSSGLIVRYKLNRAPTGWVELTDKKFQVWHRAKAGRVKTASYYAPTDVARIINNYLSPGMRGNALYDAYRNPVSFINSIRVGLSAFHACFTLVSDLSHGVGSNLVSAFESAIHGRFADAAKDLKDLAKVFNVVGSLRNAEKLYQEYIRAGASPLHADVVSILTAGGMRVGATPISEMSISMADAWKSVKTPEGWAKIPHAIMEGISWPIMGYLVPRAKLNATYRMFMKEMEKNTREGKSLTTDQQISLAQEIVKNIDNIFGQLVYDNISMSRWMKDTMHVFVGFPGWNIGSFRTMAGTGRAVGHLGKEGVKAIAGLVTGKGYKYTPMDTQAKFGMEKTIGMMAVVAFLGALTQLFMAGKAPEDPYDLFFPQTGNKLPNGQPERIRWPSYIRDYIGMGLHPYETVKGKLNWPFHIFAAIADNVDYAGRQVRDPEAPFFTQGKQLGKYILSSMAPFSIQGFQRARSGSAAALSLVGLTPAPKAFSNTDAANVIDKYYSVAIARTLTPKQVKQHDMKMELMDMLREGDKAGFKKTSQEYLKSGQLTSNQVKEVIKQSSKPSLVTRFERMPLDWELKAFDVATPEERKAWEPILMRKVAGAQVETWVALKDRLVPVLKEIGAASMASRVQKAKVQEGTAQSLLDKAGLPAGIAPTLHKREADLALSGLMDKKLAPKEEKFNLPSLRMEESRKELLRRVGLGG